MNDGLNGIDFPPIQQRIRELLADGQPHKRVELLACMGDELSDTPALNSQISAMRKVLRVVGHNVICVLKNKAIHYQHVVTLPVKQETA